MIRAHCVGATTGTLATIALWCAGAVTDAFGKVVQCFLYGGQRTPICDWGCAVGDINHVNLAAARTVINVSILRIHRDLITRAGEEPSTLTAKGLREAPMELDGYIVVDAVD
ncbi:hypothetical protein F4776DRAFT_666382 [Hypoxylon sp. NC0597]|nr:hypothetical protein F4776DRAFT_666382 [Hypoxylon sp. NC0597]